MPDKMCEQCGKDFRVPPSLSHQKYCSSQCYGIAKNRRPSRRDENGMYVKDCTGCGVELKTKQWQKGKLCRNCSAKQARITAPSLKGDQSPAWKGGRRIDSYGYVKLKRDDHPFADSTGYVREHIYIIVEAIGAERFKELGGVVHHIDGDKQNNALENLYPCTVKQNADYNRDLLKLAFELVQKGIIIFEQGKYSCPLLGDE